MRRLLTLAVTVSTLVLAVWVTTAGAQVYPPTTPPTVPGTIVVGGTSVIRVGGASASLPFTGSAGTATFGLVALSLLGIGLILLVATRRRKHVLDRA